MLTSLQIEKPSFFAQKLHQSKTKPRTHVRKLGTIMLPHRKYGVEQTTPAKTHVSLNQKTTLEDPKIRKRKAMAEGKEETRRRNQKVTNQSNKQTSVVETKLQRETVQIRSDCKRTLLCMVLRNPRRRLKLEALPVKLFQIFFFFFFCSSFSLFGSALCGWLCSDRGWSRRV